MSESTAFRQMDEKHVSVDVHLMLWSPKFDLVALSNVQGEVVLHRLSWQKVWSVTPPGDDVKVTSLAWRPDGKVLAVSYSCGKINLYDIENTEVLHTIELQGQITSLTWINQAIPEGNTWSPEPYLEDDFSQFLPKLLPLSKSYSPLNTKGTASEENVEDSKKLKDQKELNLLIASCGKQDIHTFAYGVYPIVVMAVDQINGVTIDKIHTAAVSQDLRSLVIIAEVSHESANNSMFKILTYNTSLVASRDKELRMLALKCGQVASLIAYLQLTVQQMSESWEDILMEMDSKLLKFAQEKKATGSGTVSNDFLELLLFGIPSLELKSFLLHELTDKGLKKLGISIETSYTNIQKLVINHLQVVSQSLLYHLSELRGMSQWYDRFGVLGMSTKHIQEAVTAVGSFVLKTSELQQVIDDSIKNFKAFFCWLYVAILQLSDEKVPAELSKMTQHDINFVAQFLTDNFDHFSVDEEDSISELTEKRSGFKLEKVGQYLKKEDLHYPPHISANPWIQVMRSSLHIRDSDIVYPVKSSSSLVQLQESVEEIIKSALTQPSIVIGQSLSCISSIDLFTKDKSEENFRMKSCQFTCNEKKVVYTVFTSSPAPCDKFYILRQPTCSKGASLQTQGVSVRIGQLTHDTNHDDSSDQTLQPCSNHKILDLAYYDEKTLSLLLVEDTTDQLPVLVQLALSIITDDVYTVLGTNGDIQSQVNCIDVGSAIESNCFRKLENMKACSFAVSGTRKTATVLFSSRRRVRIFWMDAEEEEEDEDEEIDGSGMEEGGNIISQERTLDATPEDTDMEAEANKENTSFSSPLS
ncbi:anaphase-promoting complex subunit 4-like [Mytilus californianus]|uniref:anaphase-promoting complex subunit 4-like n=1 Tax=Mytilus californianus TaxID=6549 RepID=UPI002246C835|nr:anaphase-promoting complex subunit 4-like [Mytilus californianus]XP_052100927.1 anaphase-promoting complex subunit 4-like [Mytilus californianus]XP_052100928.1 anaphase-promoting complex subunit 4-like [Mytilus californianus]XP_052100929.1 anaphase-promoting complex subunit 4-like [Mytilus californianus]